MSERGPGGFKISSSASDSGQLHSSDRQSLVSTHLAAGYGSNLEGKGDSIGFKRPRASSAPQENKHDNMDKGRKQIYGQYYSGMDAYTRHRIFINDYIRYYGKKEDFIINQPTKTDYDVLREEYRFIRTEEDDDEETWEKNLAKKYYDKLYKEYCIADLSRYKEGKVGMRWRVEKEVFAGKGQFICGNKACNETNGLESLEVNFGYIENGIEKNALVKLRVCPECAKKLNYKNKKEKKQKEKEEKELQGDKDLKKKDKKDKDKKDKDKKDKDKKDKDKKDNKDKKEKKDKEEKKKEYDGETDNKRQRISGEDLPLPSQPLTNQEWADKVLKELLM